MRRQAAVLAALTLGAVLAPAPVAFGDSETVEDGEASAGPMDIHRVAVVNEKRLQIRIKVENLQKKPGRGAGAYIDTETGSGNKGPEFFISSGLYDSDWQISPTKGWSDVGDPLSCPIDQRLRYADDVISWTTGPKCLGEYSEVRVSVKTNKGETYDYCCPDGQMFTPWIERY